MMTLFFVLGLFLIVGLFVIKRKSKKSPPKDDYQTVKRLTANLSQWSSKRRERREWSISHI
jgi:hypothetical protein